MLQMAEPGSGHRQANAAIIQSSRRDDRNRALADAGASPLRTRVTGEKSESMATSQSLIGFFVFVTGRNRGRL